MNHRSSPVGAALLALLVAGTSLGCPKQRPTSFEHDPKFLTQLGLSEFRAGHYEAALRNLEQAKAADPNNAQVRLFMGVVLMDRGEYQRAEQELTDGLKLHPEDPDLYNARGIARTRLGHFQQAIKDFQAALAPERHYATPANALANMAASYVGLGRTEDAIATYWKALEVNPSDAVVRTALCETLANAKRMDVALRECSRATRDAPRYAPAFLKKGDLLQALAKKDAAIVAYKKAFEVAVNEANKEEARRKLIALGVTDPSITGKRRDEWKLP